MEDRKVKNAPYFKIQCCYECKRRKVGCHTDCRLYQGWVRENLRRRANIKRYTNMKDYIYEQKGKRR